MRSARWEMGSAILLGKTRRAVLGLLFSHSDEAFYLRQIIRALDAGQGAVQRELARLTEAGVLVRTHRGHQVYYQANRRSPFFDELRSLAMKTAGAFDILRSALTAFGDRIVAAFIYGSFAIGGEQARSDVDVLVIGNVSFAEVVEALRRVQERLQREVNPTVYAVEEIRKKLKAKHHFLTSVMVAPKIMLIGDERELARLGAQRLAR